MTKLLIVDDEKGIRDLLSHALRARGYGVATADNGTQALEKLKEESFALVISDINMPKLKGLEVLDEIKKINPDVEVIIMTGYGTVETAVLAMQRGASDYVLKPFDIDAISAAIEKTMEKRELKTLVAIHEASKAVYQSLDLDVILPLILKLAAKALRADDASIMLLTGENLEVAAGFGIESNDHKSARLAMGERVAGRAVKEPEPLMIIGPLENDPRFAGIESLRGIHSSIIHPLAIKGEVLGVLNVNRTKSEDPFNNADLRHTAIFCSQIAQAVANAQAYRRLAETKNQLIESEKLNTIGLLAAGISHEINNPLTSIMGFAQLMRKNKTLTPQQMEDLDCIINQSQRCSLIISDLLQFSRKTPPKKEPLPLNAALDSALRLAKHDMAVLRISVLKDCPEPSPLILADLVKMEQVFLNLIKNAEHAMASAPVKRLEIRARLRNGKVAIDFKDSGCGIPQNVLSKIFEPFFTTKPSGKGTGLGLSICREIVAQHGGTLTAASPAGQGTTFTIELPLSASADERREPAAKEIEWHK